MTGMCVHEVPTGRILDANQAILDMFGCSREESAGPGVLGSRHPSATP